MNKQLKNPATPQIAMVLFMVLFAFACTNTKQADVAMATNQVKMQNIAFSPVNITVAKGTTVTWTNSDNMTHTVTAVDGSFDSGNLVPGSTYTHTFATAGTVNYHCTIHAGMNGSVVVTGP